MTLQLPKYPVNLIEYGAPASTAVLNAPLKELEENVSYLKDQFVKVENQFSIDLANEETEDLSIDKDVHVEGALTVSNSLTVAGIPVTGLPDVNLILSYLINESVVPDLRGPLNLIKAYVDRYFDQTGIDLTHSENHFYLGGLQRIVNDGIGGFNTVLYTGNYPSNNDIIDVGFKPDFVWIKNRDRIDNHYLTDTVRGATNYILPDSSTAETTDSTALLSFNSDGFTVGATNGVNGNGENIVAWCFECSNVQNTWPMPGLAPDNEQINLNIGMSIVKYRGTGTAHAIAHNLGAAPQFMIVKNLGTITDWAGYHHQLHAGASPGDQPEDMEININLTQAQVDNANIWNDTQPDSTTFTVGTGAQINQNGQSHIAYLFTEIPGFSKFGSYEGNGGSNSVTGLGFRPEIVIIKDIDAPESWVIYDDTRDADDFLEPNSTGTEATVSDLNVQMTNDGFNITGTQGRTNRNGDIYIYAAFGKKGPALDIDLISNAIPATSEPSTLTVFSLFTPRDAATLGTDLRLFVSRVAGAETELTSNSSYWTEAPLSKLTDLAGDVDFITGEADVSSQNAGTSLRYRFVGANLKKIDFSGTYLTYR